jgi:hypothetical protein
MPGRYRQHRAEILTRAAWFRPVGLASKYGEEMRTPDGIECRYFYGDYRRGRKTEECRLIEERPGMDRWTVDLCRTCPVPDILRANACENLLLEASVTRIWLGLRRQVKVKAYCSLSHQTVTEPHVGCGQCHPLPPIFTQAKNDPDAAA